MNITSGDLVGITFIIGLIFFMYLEINWSKWMKKDKEEQDRKDWRNAIRFFRGEKDWDRDED